MGDDTTALADTIDDEGPVDTTIIGRNAYRSYFSFVRRPDSLQQVLCQFGAWLRERKAIDIDLHVSRRDTFGATTLTVAHNDKADGHQVRCVLVEDRTRESWRTELTVFVPARAGRGWVNLVASSDQGTPAKPPNVFAQIVDVLHEPRDGALPLRSQPPVIGMSQVDDLVAWIGDPERHALLLVAGTGDQLDFGPWVEKVRYWAGDMKGMAQTVVLDPPTTIRLAELVGPSHAVSPWTIRTFRPAAQITDPQDGPRHRVLSTGRMATSEDREIRQLLARVARRHANDRATPVSLARTTRDLDRVTTALLLDRIFEPEPVPAETVQLAEPATPAVAPYVPEPTVADDDVVELQALVADQARRLADVAAVLGPNWTASSVRGWQGLDNEHRNLTQRYSRDREILLRSRTQLEQSLTEVDDLRADVENLRGQLRTEEEERTLAELLRVQAEDETRWLRDQFRAQQEYGLATATMPKDRETDIPSSFDELAVRLPELGGSGVVFTGDVDIVRRLADVDASGKYALIAWESLLALTSYLEARHAGDFAGSFQQYIEATPQGYRGLPPGKHAGGESMSTMDRYGHLRDFPVPVDVDPSGSASMAAHFKLGKAGMRSPRMHYLDDYPSTGQVYVGYIGPHLRVVTTN